MILWSIIPPEMIWGTVNPPSPYEEIEYNGMKCLVEKTSTTQYRVVRLLTTNPTDYLSTELEPGKLLTYDPLQEEHKMIVS